MIYLTCDGTVSTDASGDWYTCSAQMVQQTEAEVQASLGSSATLDPVELGAVWGFAFATVLSFWIMGLKISIARQGIKQVR